MIDENETFALTVDPSRGGGIASLVDKRSGKQLIRPGEVANELRSYREYPNHPLFAEGPWHLTPDGRFTSAIDFETEVTVEVSPIGQRIRLHGPFEASRREQEIRLWAGIDRVELTTSLHDYDSHDRLFRLRFPAAVEGGAPVSETGNASPRSRSRSTIPPTTGSPSAQPRASRSGRRARPCPRRGRLAQSAWPRSSCPTTRARTMACASS